MEVLQAPNKCFLGMFIFALSESSPLVGFTTQVNFDREITHDHTFKTNDKTVGENILLNFLNRSFWYIT